MVCTVWPPKAGFARSTITINAMGYQRKIVEQQGDYIIAVKNNQSNLAHAMESEFLDEAQGLLQGRLQQDIDVTKDHGRLETGAAW